ncbi:MAG: hypothetical protein H3C51_09880 [Rubellimicrobium sp.]|nr:hypothetical protein [Rubellimicrobium sp.]
MTLPSPLPDLRDLAPDEWQAELDALGEEHGYFDPVGARHASLFLDLDRTLLVTFETMDEARRRPFARPRGIDIAARNGWSLLAFLSDGDTWFRDPAVWGTFDRLSDDGFFEDFERVLFFGIGPCGYAAAALSVAAPGARVLAIRPQATLTPAIAGWDRRFPAARRLDFTSRYGFAPDMIDAAGHADIVIDPHVVPDSIHAALFTRDTVTLHRAPWAGGRPEALLDRMDITDRMIDAAMDGSLTPTAFSRMWRARRENAAYLRGLVKRLEAQGRTALARRVCAHGATLPDGADLARKLRELGALEAAE